MSPSDDPARFDLDLTEPEPIPEEGIERAVQLLRTGRLFRYGDGDGNGLDDAAHLEERMAELVDRRYAVAVSSCGAALFLALRAGGVRPGDRVLVNGYTLAPVPGAIEHAGAAAVLVEVDDRLTIDLDDLRRKAAGSGATTLLLSHMRGHVADLDGVGAVCDELGITLIEDCAHTLGAAWDGRPTGSFGRVGCFSLQTYKHVNAGEGGVLVTDDAELAARAILHSGSYMNYQQHRVRPPAEVFEPLRGTVPNYSMRLTALAAALALSQLDLLTGRIAVMNQRHAELERLLGADPLVRTIPRDPRETYVGSSLQFGLPDLDGEQIDAVVRIAGDLGLHLAWYGAARMRGFTSRPSQWEYVAGADLPRTEALLASLCDLRIPPAMTEDHACRAAGIIRHAIGRVARRPPGPPR